MTHVLSFLPEVEDDAVDTYTWYESKARGLGEEFLRVFYACAREISRNPFMYRRVYKEFRRRLLRRFPYAMYFRVEEEQVVVYGLFHCARDPQRVENALADRGKPNR